MRKQQSACTILLLTLLLACLRCGEGEREGRPGDALACVNQECLTKKELEYQIPDAHRESIRLGEKKEYVRSWIRDEILYQEAKRQKLDQNQEVKSQPRQKIREILVAEFIEQKLRDRIRVTEEETRGHYQENRSRYVWEDDYLRVSHIFTRGMAEATLADLLLKEGNRFEDVVAKTSEDENTKANGGDLGFVRIKDLSPEIAESASKLTTGETSPPIATPHGYEIIKVTGRRQKGTPMEFEWAKEQITDRLTLQHRQRAIDALVTQAAAKAEIQTFDWASDISSDEIK
jgi:peptidyl-prolyl cis-trans isomerase C